MEQPAKDQVAVQQAPSNQPVMGESSPILVQPQPTPHPYPIQRIIIAPMNVSMFRDESVLTTCPYCLALVYTDLVYENGCVTWLSCCLCMFTGIGQLGCCFIPFFLNDCKDVLHICPNCNRVIAKWNRF